jgi:hypothetical protein
MEDPLSVLLQLRPEKYRVDWYAYASCFLVISAVLRQGSVFLDTAGLPGISHAQV